MTNPATSQAQALQASARPVRDDGSRPIVAILTLGCKLNLADSESMARRMRDAGWSVAERPAGADAVIVNTCSVTHVADAKSRHLVRLARRVAAGARVAVTGCMLETAAPQLIDGLGADLVYRQPHQTALTNALIDSMPTPVAGYMPRIYQTPPAPAFRTRAFVSAQEGCDDVCAFCIVPKTRGRERSKDVDAIVAEVQAREAEGAKEVVITGTQLGAWGREQGNRGLLPVLQALVQRTSVPRIRMSSVQPQDLSPDMVDLWQDPRLCRHFHLALQSGSQTVLERMRRRYSARQYREAVELLRCRIPDVAITTDVIAGFPGETEADFEKTVDFCREMAFAGMHVFPYSQRRGTVAARMPGQLADAVKKERVHRLMALANQMAAAYRERFIGTTQMVLWESARQSEDARTVWEGLTDTYVRVYAESAADLENQVTPALLQALPDGRIRAEVPALDS
jgi:threonylcarbamoyladenosine tRNA methylthiotransferase MtaB